MQSRLVARARSLFSTGQLSRARDSPFMCLGGELWRSKGSLLNTRVVEPGFRGPTCQMKLVSTIIIEAMRFTVCKDWRRDSDHKTIKVALVTRLREMLVTRVV